jgi:transcriptional regulator of acetoin/glycerol metabolism
MMTESDIIDVRDLPEVLRQHTASDNSTNQDLMSLDELHRMHVRQVLEKVGGNKARAAKILGINRATLYRLLKKDMRSTRESMK